MNLDRMARDQVIAMALSLANLFSSTPGMRSRAQAMTMGLLANPEKLPNPALLDWMIVDLDIAVFESCLRELGNLEPPPALVDIADLSPLLRSAAWRWVPPSS